MLKKFAGVALLTGGSQLISLYVISYIAKNTDPSTLGSIAYIDSTVVLISAIISFGIQTSAMREVIINPQWKDHILSVQKGKLAVAFFISAYGLYKLITTHDITNLVFLIAPLIALNADFVLYSLGQSIKAAQIAFVRLLFIQTVLILTAAYFTKYTTTVYLLVLAAGTLVAGLVSSKMVTIPYWQFPKTGFLKIYSKNLLIGFSTIAESLLSIGLIAVVSGFYLKEEIGYCFTILKFYLVFTGLKRIILQTFYKEITDKEIALIIDKTAIITGSIFLSLCLFYPTTILELLFKEYKHEWNTMVQLIGLTAFISSITPTAGLRLLIQRRDKAYAWSIVGAGILALVTSISLSFTQYSAQGIMFGILAGEFFLLIAFVYHLNEKSFFKHRLSTILKVITGMLIYLIMHKILGESLLAAIGSVFFFCIYITITDQTVFKFIKSRV